MPRTMRTSDNAGKLTPGILARPDPKPLAGSFVAGVIASLCCGGSLIFTSMGLGAFYSSLGLFRYVPQALAAGALSIVAINYLSYGYAAKQASHRSAALREKMFVTTAVGLIAMAGAFILLEWLNHAVVHGDRFLIRPEFSQAFIRGVPNVELLYVCATFFALALLWALPFPRDGHVSTDSDGWMNRTLRVAVFAVAAVLILAVALDATASHQHGPGH